MKALFGHLYDQTGVCPKCGHALRPVRYYTAVEGTHANLGSRQITRGSKQYTQTFTSTSYSDIRERHAGFCDACDRAEFDQKEANWPKPSRAVLIGAIAGGVLLAAGVATLLLLFRRYGVGAEEAKGKLNAAFGVGVAGMVALFFLLPTCVSQRRAWAKHRKGFRAAYQTKTEAELSEAAKANARPYPPDGLTYFSLSDMETMRRMNGQL